MLATEPQDRGRHVLLDSRAGWRAAVLDGVEPAEDGALRLAALPGAGRPLLDQGGTFAGLDAPTGVAVDPWNRVYVADTRTHQVKRFDPCCGAFVALPCLGGEGAAPRRLRAPRGLAVSSRGELFVADSGNRRVQVLSLKGLALLAILGPLDARGRPVAPAVAPGPAGCPPEPAFPAGTWLPWDLAMDSRGALWVTDHDGGLVHRFDAGRRWHAAFDLAAPGNPPLVAPTHLAVDTDDRLHVVQHHRPYVVIADRDGTYLGRAEAPGPLAGRFRPGAVASDPDGNIYVADQLTRRLHRYRCPASPGTPVRFARGSCEPGQAVAGLAFDRSGNALTVGPDAGGLRCLDGPAAFAVEGRLIGQALDSRVAACQWHLVRLRGELPAGGAVVVHTHTAEAARDPAELADLPEDQWATAQAWTEPALGEWDCLVLSPPGRYLWLRLTLSGSGAASPLVRSVRIDFPRQASTRHLPAVYRATPGTFLDRFVSIFDTILGGVAGVLDDLPAYLDPDSVPTADGPRDFLRWLASWLALSLDATWDEARRRRLVANAARLYAGHGTPRGLREAVRLALGLDLDATDIPVPGVVEDFALRRWLVAGAGTLGDRALWGRRVVDRLALDHHSTIGTFKLTDLGDPLRDPLHHGAHRFTVFVPAACVPGETDRRALERTIELAKPAHTVHRLELVEPRFRVGVQATVGMDTVVGRWPAGVQAGRSRLGWDALLQDPPDQPPTPRFQVGVRAQVGAAAL